MPLRMVQGPAARRWPRLALSVLPLLPGCSGGGGERLREVPGIVLHHEPAPASLRWGLSPPWVYGRPRIYVTSGSIAVLPTGEYVVAGNSFGPESGAGISGTTWVYRSADRGRSWRRLATLTGMKRGSLFVHEGGLYLLGYEAAPGRIVIRRSSDGGLTWTAPRDETTGVLFEGEWGGTPQHPVAHDGRIWAAQGTRFLSASVTADLLRRDAWILSPAADTRDGPVASRGFHAEPQVMASPRLGVAGMPLVTEGRNHAVLIRSAGDPRDILDPGPDEWISLPGAEKKFAARYDAASDRFWALTNPVLLTAPWERTDRLTRNTAALLSSRDMRHWDVEQIFLYTAHARYEAFQYFQFDIDGEDLVIVSRTAFDVGGNRPPRGHDSNLLTFHRIENFRQAVPRHALRIAGNDVWRMERTQHESAPLGRFANGLLFAGAPLRRPAALGQTDDGDVWIREESGRILRFDALGNFLAVSDEAPFPLSGRSLPLFPPPRGERSWIHSRSGRWADPDHWFYWNRPDTSGEIAIFGSAITEASDVILDRVWAVKGLRFRSANSYVLAGTGGIRLDSGEGAALLEAFEGSHDIRVPVTLAHDVEVRGGSDAALRLSGGLDLAGHTLRLHHPAVLRVRGPLAMNGGMLEVDGQAPLHIDSREGVILDGTLRFVLPSGVVPAEGGAFHLVSFAPGHTGTFSRVELPAPAPGLRWDVGSLYKDGIVTVRREQASSPRLPQPEGTIP